MKKRIGSFPLPAAITITTILFENNYSFQTTFFDSSCTVHRVLRPSFNGFSIKVARTKHFIFDYSFNKPTYFANGTVKRVSWRTRVLR